MQSAQLWREHIAQLTVMQWAYPRPMATMDSPRQENRRRQLEKLIQEAGSAADLARISGTPKTHISAIQARRRGIGDELAAKWEALMDKPAGWMDQRDPSGSLVQQDTVARVSSGGVAHILSHPQEIIPSQQIEWRDLMNEAELPDEFSLRAVDDAMAPLLPAGNAGLFSRKLKAEPGKHVLVVDKNGAFYIRKIQERLAGQWRGIALNDTYAPLDFAEDGLRVVAVMRGLLWE